MDATEDKLEILEMIGRYSHGVDDLQAETYAGVFMEDGAFKGPNGAGVKGQGQFKGLINIYKARRGNLRWRHHQSTTIFLELGENRAVTRTYLMTTGMVQEGEPPASGLTAMYEDEFVRTPAGWRIKSREISKVKGEIPFLQKLK
jgi:hypothetical protein